MFFSDYKDTGYVYHVAAITDLKDILENGIKYNDKNTYIDKYLGFHKYIDSLKNEEIPHWVQREKAIYASMNYSTDHQWHSHSVVLGLKVNPSKCWIANESLANKIYEPFILQHIDMFSDARDYLDCHGERIIRKYWDTSLSFKDNLKLRKDRKEGYDEEVLIFHSIPPDDIKPIYIISDHEFTTIENWIKYFKGED
ncbi:hypothetical protein CLPU_20c00110 [Gottschalkia purinilytica]|uniref:Uncharacterized protein n=1 Tax=Gottschalkia purinilytica TaxID=1503 RepID=A0A0L0W7F1_GOTPU|nr:DarT ssDNA thymidine ADP-ribosyltransferase family protein [Gottschalkia purinilytica]KNF07235.1 hypothetical protein CLPU_20c00110 [Gottschalkia purinilytica]